MRELPNVVEMEKFVLSALLLKKGEIVSAVSAILNKEDFYRGEHQVIYGAILELYNEGIVPNLLSLIEKLHRAGMLNKMDLRSVMALGDLAHTTAYVEEYAKVIKEKATLRKLIYAGEEISSEAYQDMKPVSQILENAEQKILSVTLKSTRNEFENITPILERSFDRIRQLFHNPESIGGVGSGFEDLDRITNGFQRSDLILIAARPSMGKTSFALNIAMNAALAGRKVAIFSLEMSKLQLGTRLLVADSKVDSLKVNTGQLTEEEFMNIVNAFQHLQNISLFIDDTVGISALELRSKARRLKMDSGLDLIVIDYLQLMQGSSSNRLDSNRQQEISEISRNLKALAREIDVPVIALSQLSRNVELRADKRPQLSDLRESGSLEQDADMVMFLYRENYYKQEAENENLAELIIAKNRNGPTTNLRLFFNKECMLFTSVAYVRDDDISYNDDDD